MESNPEERVAILRLRSLLPNLILGERAALAALLLPTRFYDPFVEVVAAKTTRHLDVATLEISKLSYKARLIISIEFIEDLIPGANEEQEIHESACCDDCWGVPYH